MTKGVNVDAKTFCLTWQKSGGDSEKVAQALNQTDCNVINRYKRYRELGINLCDMKPVPKKPIEKLKNLIPELNLMLEEVNNGN